MISYRYKAKMVRVVDGDTIDFNIDLGFHVWMLIRVRLEGVNTPEVHGVKHASEEYQEGLRAMDYVEDWFEENASEWCEVETQKTGKYGRWIAKVYAGEDEHEVCLNDVLSRMGWADI